MKSFESCAADADDRGKLADPQIRRVFMLRLLDELPLNASEQAWLAGARQYASGDATDAELEKWRIEAWNSLGTNSCNFTDPSVNRTRAVICVLFPPTTSDEALDEVLNFEEFFVGAGGEEQRAVAVLMVPS
jgi:hypothetical protein